MQNNRSKVLFFLFGGVGGAERMTLNFGKMLPKDRFDVTFVVCGRMKNILEFVPAGYNVEFIGWHNIYVFPRLRLAAMILKHKPDFVFSSTQQLNVLLLQVASWLNVSSVVRSDNMMAYISEGLKRKLSQYYPLAHRIVAQTEEMKTEIIENYNVKSENVICLHNPIDVQTINEKIQNGSNPYPQDESVNYVWVANFTPVKAHDVLIKAFEKVHKANQNANLYFVGKVDKEDSNYCKVQKNVNDSIYRDFIHFTGFQSNPYVWMKYADCFVLPSRLEGLPNVLLEAMYLGTPVVASTCVPIIERIVNEGYNGYKVKPEDVDGLANAMEKALLLKDFEIKFQDNSVDYITNLFIK